MSYDAFRFSEGDRVVLLTIPEQPRGRVLTRHREGRRRWYGVWVVCKDVRYYTIYEEGLEPENPLDSLARALREKG